MKKRYGLFKVLAVLLFLLIVVSYFVKGRSGEIQYLAFGDIFFNYIQSYYYFFDTILFILVVGGFYGLLDHISAYKLLVQKIVNKVDNKSKLFIIIITIVFALLSSFTGLNFILLLFVPFVVSIILLLGYDKLVALSATVGATVIGLIGGVFVTFKNVSDPYSSGYTTFEKMVGLKKSWNLSTTLPKCVLLVIGIVLLIFYILSHIKSVTSKSAKYHLTKSDPLFIESKDKNGKKISVSLDNTKVKVWPFVLIISIMFILLFLGYLPWSDLFGIKVFNKFHEWLVGISIGKYTIFSNLISNSISAFGTWSGLGSYMMAILLICLSAFLLTVVYRIKFSDAMDGFIYGIKKMILPAMLVGLAYTVLVCSYSHGFIETIITNASKSFGDNVVIHSLIAMLGSILNVDLYYTPLGVFSNIVTNLSDKANLSVYTIMFQSLYGLVQIVGPTSILLITGLSYLEVPYKSWIKYIWRFVVELLIAIFVILMFISIL